jgi:hypothetical protein
LSTQPISDARVGGHSTAGLPPIDFDDFHRHELPRRLREGANERVHWDVRGAAPIAIRLAGSDSAYSYVADTAVVRVERGVVADAEVVLEIPGGPWQDYVYEMRTRFGLLYSGAVRFVSGTFEQWDVWEPALRCLYSGRPIYDPKTVRFIDRDGSPLDLRRRFARSGRGGRRTSMAGVFRTDCSIRVFARHGSQRSTTTRRSASSRVSAATSSCPSAIASRVISRC